MLYGNEDTTRLIYNRGEVTLSNKGQCWETLGEISSNAQKTANMSGIAVINSGEVFLCIPFISLHFWDCLALYPSGHRRDKSWPSFENLIFAI